MTTLKIALATFCLAGGIATSKAQDISVNSVPATIKSTFEKEYPKAKDVEWEKAGANYEVSFDVKSVDYEVVYNSAGKTISLEKDIRLSSLPKSIRADIKTRYPKARIDDVDQVSKSGKVTYKIDLEKTPDVVVWYSADGKFIKEKAD